MDTSKAPETGHDSPSHGLCPWWVGLLLASPLRRIWEKPEAILEAHVRPGMTVIDLGCAMGYFSLPLARMVGDDGRVVCIDVQQRMLKSLSGKIRRHRLQHIMETRLCRPERLDLADLSGNVDLVLAWHVIHEVPHPGGFFRECALALRPEGRLLFAEPSGHVDAAEFEQELELARQAGLEVLERRTHRRSCEALLGIES